MYDKNNVFAKIVRGELAVGKNKIYENEYAMSFYDVNPQAEIHALVIPKGEYENIADFTANANEDEQKCFWMAFNETLEILNLHNDFNVFSNTGKGPFEEQTVMHFHLHILGGKKKK